MDRKYISLQSESFFAFNVWSIESAKAVIDGCAAIGRNALVQTSMKAYAQCNPKQLREFLTSYSKDKGIQVFLHLDHCKDVNMITDAIKMGWDSVMIDGSTLELQDNIHLTNEASSIAHMEGVLVEAEVGQITGKTGVADLNDVRHFMDNVNVDTIAVAIGTIHGLYDGLLSLDYDLLDMVNKESEIPLVIHGGSGLSDDVLLRLISFSKVKKINISTDVKQAYRRAIEHCFTNGICNQKGFDPLIVTKTIHQEISEMVMAKERLLERA